MPSARAGARSSLTQISPMTGWQEAFPQLKKTNDAVVHQLMDKAALLEMPPGAAAFHQGDACSNYLLVVEGTVKVLTRAENGREIVLYRLGSGDSCVLTTSCLFGNRNYPAEGLTETNVRVLAIPAKDFERALQQSSAFRDFVFSSFSAHVASLITLVEEVAFGRMDIRLARHLLKRVGAGKISREEVWNSYQNLAGMSHEGILGPCTYGPKNRNGSEVVKFYRVTGGKIVPITDWVKTPDAVSLHKW